MSRALLVLCLAIGAEAAEVRVTTTGTGSGTTWADAAGLVPALTAAQPGDSLWLAAGTYTPGTVRSATFSIPAGVAIYGGFVGGETALAQRRDDPALVVLSGEIGSPASVADNSQKVVTLAGSGTRLDTLTISGAYDTAVGAAIFSTVASSRIAINRCLVIDNSAYGGVAVWLSSCNDVALTRCVVRSNHQTTAPGYTTGTVMVTRDASANNTVSLRFSDLVITGNQSAGLFLGFSTVATSLTAATVENAVIAGNQGPGITADRGVFSAFGYGSLTVQASTIVGNVGESIYQIGSQLNVRNSVVDGALTIYSGSLVRESVWSIPVDGDPRFTDPGNPVGPDGLWGTADDGYRLRADSPVIDQGRMATATADPAAPAHDLLGIPRPRNRDPDPGAYEFDSGNSAPMPTAATVTVLEDALTPVLLGGSDVDGDTMTGIITSLPAEGVLYPTADGIGASGPALTIGDLPFSCPVGSRTILYRPAADANGPARTSFGFALRDALVTSHPATVAIDVTAVNDPPTLGGLLGLIVAEDSGSRLVVVTGLGAGGGESQALSVTATSSDGSIIPDPPVTYLSPATTAMLTFTPMPDAFGTVTITVTVHDDGGTAGGGADTTTGSFTVDVVPVNDPPSIDPIPDRHIPEDATAPADLHVVVGGMFPGPFEGGQTLNVVATSADQSRLRIGPIDASHLNVAGLGSAAFDLQPQPDATGSVLVYVTVFDDGDTAFGGANNATRLFTVTLDPVNDLPGLAVNTGIDVAALGDAPVGPAVLRLADADAPAAASLVLTLAAAPAWGDLLLDGIGLTAGATFTQADIDAGRLSYHHRVFGSVSDALTIAWSDGIGAAQGPATVAIRVIGTIRPVVVLPGPGPAWTEGGGPVRLDAGALVTDPDSLDLEGGAITAAITAGGEAADRLVILDQGAGADHVSLAGSTVQVGGRSVGSWAGGAGPPLVVSLAGPDATPAAAQAIVRAIAFDHADRNPGAAVRTVQVVVGDGDVGDSVPASTTVQIVPVDDPPAILTTAVGCVAGVARDAFLAVDDPDSPHLTWSVAVPSSSIAVSLTDPATGRLHIDAAPPGRDRLTMTVSDGVNPPQSAEIEIVATGADDPRPHAASDPPAEAFIGEAWRFRLRFDLIDLGGSGDLEFAPLGDAPAGLALTRIDAATVDVAWDVPAGEPPGHHRFAILAADRVTGAAGELPVLLLVRTQPSSNQ